jgi:hypothetical protein
MPFFRPDLVILQALKPQLAFDPLTQLLVVIGQLLRIPAFCRGEVTQSTWNWWHSQNQSSDRTR